ncbi:NDMA-dependent alcohol dehydrogenase [Gordonia sp. LSe1-13]|uniref:alcohol dehydrogenase n=1 Tax=Gordonia sesuvii TaxID=3116777 RepID=A0ABU7MJH7_9ACTN|nr:NDMA-dependent alcohol dehydrogenase [Gordonia sp. LSe1-13]
MQTRGAILRKTPGTYEVVDLEVDDPRNGEVQIQLVASGLCHSDDHIATGDIPSDVLPWAGGHEGAGVITKVGPGTRGFKEGDHVVLSFLPGCGRCRWCATGHQNLCDTGASLLTGARFDDPGSFRLSLDGQPVGQMLGISTFCETTTVAIESVVKIPDDVPLDVVCLLGCGVGTGWGSAVNSAKVAPGDTVIVMGVGGVGINAVQGARHAGAANIIAVDPVAFKRETALKLGATHAFDSMDEATEIGRQLTNGQGAAAAIVTVGVVSGDIVAQAFRATRKLGTTVVTSIGPADAVGVPISLTELTNYQKKLVGSLAGEMVPSWSILEQLEMYQSGALRLDELITTRYRLDDIAQGYEDMHAGKNIRGLIEF